MRIRILWFAGCLDRPLGQHLLGLVAIPYQDCSLSNCNCKKFLIRFTCSSKHKYSGRVKTWLKYVSLIERRRLFHLLTWLQGRAVPLPDLFNDVSLFFVIFFNACIWESHLSCSIKNICDLSEMEINYFMVKIIFQTSIVYMLPRLLKFLNDLTSCHTNKIWTIK